MFSSQKCSKNVPIQKMLIKTQEMMWTIINNIPQHVFWKDINSKFMGCNKNFAKSFGLKSTEDIINKTDYDLTDKDNAERFIASDKEIIATKKPIFNIIASIKTADGKKIWISINKVPLCEKDEVTGIIGTFEDITDKIVLERKLQKSEEKYRSLIESTNTSYIIMDAELNILEANNKFIKLIKCDDEGCVLNKNPRIWVMQEDIEKFDSAFKGVLSGHPVNEMEIKLFNKNCQIRAIISASVIENGVQKIFCLVRDVTHKITEEEIKYIADQKAKDRIKQNIMQIREKLKEVRLYN